MDLGTGLILALSMIACFFLLLLFVVKGEKERREKEIAEMKKAKESQN